MPNTTPRNDETQTIRLTRDDGARFVVSIDEYGLVDSITQDGLALGSGDAVARFLLAHKPLLKAGGCPHGFRLEAGQ